MHFFKPLSARNTIPFSLEQHSDISDYTTSAGDVLESSPVTPDKYEQGYWLSPKNTVRIGITGLYLCKIRDPIFNRLVIESAHVSIEDRFIGDSVNLSYRARDDIWELFYAGSDSPNFRTATDIADILSSRSKNTKLLIDPDSASGITSAGILQSLLARLQNSDVEPLQQKTLYRFDWPTKSVLPDGRNDTTMQYMHTHKNNVFRQELSITSLHKLHPTDDSSPDTSLTTLYQMKRYGKQSVRRGVGSIIMNSHALSSESLSLLSKTEAEKVAEHHDCLREARTHIQTTALTSYLWASS